ncbi:hypothetical protein ACH82I_11840 [Brevibacterium sp. GP-SGM9]|uniref:hypothetical protein n=1 Tax=Brevibacterium sp. GP-SGM9 TaxID=3376990 RepID=UPI0039A45E77
MTTKDDAQKIIVSSAATQGSPRHRGKAAIAAEVVVAVVAGAVVAVGAAVATGVAGVAAAAGSSSVRPTDRGNSESLEDAFMYLSILRTMMK